MDARATAYQYITVLRAYYCQFAKYPMYDKCYMLNLLSSLREMLLFDYQIMLLQFSNNIQHNGRSGVEHEIIMFFPFLLMVCTRHTGNVSKIEGNETRFNLKS